MADPVITLGESTKPVIKVGAPKPVVKSGSGKPVIKLSKDS